jgi:adenine-specific DNA-methyltransferase
MLTNFLAGAEAASSDEFIRHCLTFDRQKTLGHYITFVPPTLARVVDKILSSSTTYLKDDEIFSGIDVMQDFVSKNHLGTLGNAHAVGEGIFVISEEEKNSLKLTADELSLLRPYYTTREIGRYYASPGNRYWIIYAGKDLNKKIGRYPNIKRHLDQYQDVITSVNKPYGLHRTRDEQNFIGDKLLSIRKCSRPSVAMVTFPCYVSRAFLVIKTARIDMKWLLAFLNSRLAEFWLAHKGKRQGNNYQVDKEPLLNIPIKIPSKSDMVHIAKCVDELLAMTSPGATADSKPMEMQLCERQIDRLVYGIFGLTADEIEIVEGNAK